MKHRFYILLPVILLINFHAVANSILHKGCHLFFSHQVQEKTLLITAYYTGDYCYDVSASTQVFFGNGDQVTWTTTETPYSTSYVYSAYGEYTVQVYTNGQYDFEFVAVVGQDTSGASGCNGTFPCNPSFDNELLYSQTNEEYFLTCTRTDSCKGMEYSWIIGPATASLNPVTFPFGKIEEGSVVTVCLKIHYVFCDSTVCKEILFTEENASVIDAIEDSASALHTFPNPVHDQLQVVTVNLKNKIALSIYSLDGRKILNYDLQPAATPETFSINVENFPGGIYFVRAISGDGYSSMQKIVKE